MLTIKLILIGYTFGWVLTQWLNKGFLYFGKLTWLKYICQKCITFWLTVILATVNHFVLMDIIMVSSIAAMLAYLHQNKLEE